MRSPQPGWLERVAWDGALPLITVSIPWLMSVWLRQFVELGGILTIAVLPFAATIVRCRIGYQQLETICEGRPTVMRQVFLAGAIVVLLFFESFTNGLQFAQGAPQEVIWILLSMYAIYLVLVLLALKPRRKPAPQSFAFEDWELVRRSDVDD